MIEPVHAALTRAEIDVLLQIVKGYHMQRPVWDGHIIGPTTARGLRDKGLVHHAHGYWHPSYAGREWARLLADLVDAYRHRPDRHDVGSGDGSE